MTSRERIMAAINHRTPDRVPMDLGGCAASGIDVSAYVRLKDCLGIPRGEPEVFDIYGMMARVEPEIIQRLGVDVLLVPSLCPRFNVRIDRWKKWKLFDGTTVRVPADFQTTQDADGSLFLMVEGKAVGHMPKDGHFFSEIANSTMGSLDSLVEPPDPDTVNFSGLTEEDLRFREKTARDLHESTDKALIVDLVDNIRWDTSIPNWLYAMAADPERTAALHEKKGECLLAKVKQLAQAVGNRVSVFAIYQDYGTQRGELIGPDTFARLVVPPYRKLFKWIHQNTEWKILFHSCGSIYRLIPHMIEMGVDILNPVQCNAEGMDPRRLKAEFGDRLVFWGAGVDTQTILPFGTPGEVRQQVQERIAALAPGGGFVFAPTQDIQPEVPAQNVLAMYQTARDHVAINRTEVRA